MTAFIFYLVYNSYVTLWVTLVAKDLGLMYMLNIIAHVQLNRCYALYTLDTSNLIVPHDAM